jgi:predicted CopG family antitoxin
MGPKTIELDGVAYERLRAEKREGESFGDVVKRVTEAVRADWIGGFGEYEDVDGERLERSARKSQEGRGAGLAARQSDVFDALAGDRDDGSDA